MDEEAVESLPARGCAWDWSLRYVNVMNVLVCSELVLGSGLTGSEMRVVIHNAKIECKVWNFVLKGV